MKHICYLIFVFVILLTQAQLKTETKYIIKHRIMYKNSVAVSLDVDKYLSMRSTPKWNKLRRNQEINLQDLSLDWWGQKVGAVDVQYYFEDLETHEAEFKNESFKYKVENDRMLLTKDYKEWSELQIKVVGMRKIKQFDNETFMVVFLSCKYFEGEFAIIEN